MYLFENPVLQHELVANLRMRRAFILLLVYVAALAAVVYLAWPQDQRLDLTNPTESRQLVNLFFLGQFILASLIAPSFAAGALSGEKERVTFELLVASPLKPGAIILGKLLASLAHVALLVFASLPIVVLCLPLGGVSIYEVGAAYLALLLSILTFGMISIASSSYFRRTAASLVVSYLVILPLAMIGAWFWAAFAETGATFRLFASVTLLPGLCVFAVVVLYELTSRRLLHPPDLGSEGKEVVDEHDEMQRAVGLVIQRGQFPDNLFAPAKRTDLLEDGANPVLDKELRSEIFSQGTLMLRLVIQLSMVLALPLMWVCFYSQNPERAPYYVGYVLLFNMMVGPVFSAGSVTGERERQTLELLLTTILSPWQILWAKLISTLRVSTVLTMFLVWPLILACAMVPVYWDNIPAMIVYLLIIVLSCLSTGTLALCCSVVSRKTSIAMMTSYLILIVLYFGPPAAAFFANTFFPTHAATPWIAVLGITSPFAAAFNVPLSIGPGTADAMLCAGYFAFWIAALLALIGTMIWLFKVRWRVAG